MKSKKETIELPCLEGLNFESLLEMVEKEMISHLLLF